MMSSAMGNKGGRPGNNAHPAGRNHQPESGNQVIHRTKKPEQTRTKQPSPPSGQSPEGPALNFSTEHLSPQSVKKTSAKSKHPSTLTSSFTEHPAEMTSAAKQTMPLLDEGCAFCSMARDTTKAVTKVSHGPWDPKFLVVQPIDPVAEGHVIVIPREAHVKDTRNDRVFGETSACASRVAQKLYPGRDVNIITNQGPLAGQTVWHLHIHIVPRCAGDGLIMPWTGQKKGHYNTADKPAHPDSVKPKFPPKSK